jgi:uncharacterized membrane protein
MTTPKIFWLFTLAVLLIQAALAYPELPDQVVTHMGLNGTADKYGPKDAFFLSFGLGVVLINIIPPLFSLLLKKIPDRHINLPNKEYWFANPLRKLQAIDKMVGMMAAVMGMINVLFILILQRLTELTLGQTPSFPIWVLFCMLPLLILLPPIYLFYGLRISRE